MGRVDPVQVSASDAVGGTSTMVFVKFATTMPPGEQDPVTYTGDTQYIRDDPPNLCPYPPCAYGTQETCFSLGVKQVPSPKQITVSVHGPTVTKHATFTIFP